MIASFNFGFEKSGFLIQKPLVPSQASSRSP